MTSSKTKRIDFIAPPFSGHLYPLIELAKPLLANEEYEVRFLTGPKKIELLTELGFQTVALLPERPTAMEEIANTEQAVKSNGFSMMKQLKENLQIIPEITNQIREEISLNHTDLIVADFIAVPGGIVANEKNIPWITTIPTPFAIETQEGVPSYLGGLKPNSSLVGRVRNYLGRKLIRFFKKVVVYFFRKEIRELGVTLYNQKGEEAIYSPYAILGLGMREVEFNTDFPEQFVFAGPCCASPEEDVKLLLKRKSL
jgi:UDP:flavonoid glycosyltransferase YjiC (YdhE family)